MAKQSTVLKETKTLTLNTTGELILNEGVYVDTEDFGTLDLQVLLEKFNGKIVKVTVKEQSDEELEIE